MGRTSLSVRGAREHNLQNVSVDIPREKLVVITRENRRLVERAWLEELINDGWPLALAEELLALSHSIIRGFAARALVIDDPAHFDRLLTRWRSMVDTLANEKNTVIQNIKKEASR